MPSFAEHGHGRVSRETREQLISAGIPPEYHTFDGLADLFPPEFKIKDGVFEADTVAAILMHLMKHGVLKPRGLKQKLVHERA